MTSAIVWRITAFVEPMPSASAAAPSLAAVITLAVAIFINKTLATSTVSFASAVADAITILINKAAALATTGSS